MKNGETCECIVIQPVQSCVPVSVERVDKDKDADENVDADQTRTERPVSGQPTSLFTQLEEIDIDFRVSGLPHAVVKQAENFRVRELVKKNESHPHGDALQADLQRNNIYNPFSDNSKAMIREIGNVELFELCETIPKVWKRCRKRVDGQEEHYEGIHHRFLRGAEYRDSQLKIGWTEQKCIELDKLAQKDHSYRLSRDEFQRYQIHWYLTLNKSGKNGPMRLQSDFRIVSTENQEKNVQNLFLFNTTKDDTLLPQVIYGELGHVQKLVEFMSSVHF